MAVIKASFGLVDLREVKSALRRRIEQIAEGALLRKVIVVINGKGGVGKSSLSVSLAYSLAAIGKRVLLIEMDKQGNNCEDLGITGTQLDDNGAAQAAAILDGKPLVPTGEARPNLFVVPGGTELESVVEELYIQRRYASYQDDDESQTAWMAMYTAAVEAIRDDYDVILLDVAPGSEVLQLQALTGGEMVIIPSKSDPSSRKGLRVVATLFGRARAHNAALRLLGVVLFATNTSATRVHDAIKSKLEADLSGAAPVFEQSIRHVEAAAVACRSAGKVPQEMRSAKGIDPSLVKSVKALAGDYQSLAMEIVQAWIALDNEEEAA